jgi:hypothetical protein
LLHVRSFKINAKQILLAFFEFFAEFLSIIIKIILNYEA